MDRVDKKLVDDVRYTIGDCCGLCKHSTFVGVFTFGECKVNYKEMKGAEVHAYGHCRHYETDNQKREKLQGQKQFGPEYNVEKERYEFFS